MVGLPEIEMVVDDALAIAFDLVVKAGDKEAAIFTCLSGVILHTAPVWTYPF